jgi:ribosomal protein L20A (L18A)
MAKHTTIWKSYGMYDLKELEKFEKDVKELLEEDAVENITEEKITDEVYFQIDQYFDDERLNLDKKLDGRILCIADMGLWNGRRSGYMILGNNLNEVLTCGIGCDEKEVYCDGRNVLAKGYHHDGRNYVEFREIREDRNIENLLTKLYNNEEVTRKEINYYTRSLRPYVKQIYGV